MLFHTQHKQRNLVLLGDFSAVNGVPLLLSIDPGVVDFPATGRENVLIPLVPTTLGYLACASKKGASTIKVKRIK